MRLLRAGESPALTLSALPLEMSVELPTTTTHGRRVVVAVFGASDQLVLARSSCTLAAVDVAAGRAESRQQQRQRQAAVPPIWVITLLPLLVKFSWPACDDDDDG